MRLSVWGPLSFLSSAESKRPSHGIVNGSHRAGWYWLRLTVVTFGFQGGWYREGASEGEAPLYKNPDNIHVESLMTV